MAMYSAKEMKAKMTGKKVRELELKDGKQIKVWIPKNEFYYERKHFNIKMVDRFKNAQNKAVTCINSEAHVTDCPVCDYIQELWGQWRATTDTNEKKRIQGLVNRLSADVYYVNVVDIADKTLSCYSLRLTNSMFNSITEFICSEGDSGKDINHVLWTIKKTVNNGNVKYAVFGDYGDDEKGNQTAMKLTRNIAKICDREESRGGYIDLDKAYAQNITVDEYMKKLYGDFSNEEVETNEKPIKRKDANITISDEELSLDEVEEEPVKKPVKKVSKKPVVEEDDLDLDEDIDEKPVQKKTVSKKPVVEDDDLDLDEESKKVAKKPVVEDDDLDLDEEPVKKHIKKKTVEIEDDDLELDDLDEEPEEKPKKVAKKPAKQIDDSELDDLELDDVPF